MKTSKKRSWNGRHVLITGGSSGIGLAMAKLWATRGAQISLLARDEEKLKRAQAELQSIATLPVQIFAADVSDAAQCEYSIGEAVRISGPLSVLVANAGVAFAQHFDCTPPEAFESAMRINYFGALYCVRAALPSLEEAARAQKSHIVLVSSGAALIGIWGYSAYAPSKFALRGLGEVLRAELKPRGVEVCVIYPPDTDTPQLHEENKTKPPQTRAIAGAATTWSAEDVAREILRGVERGKFRITPGLELSLLARFHSLAEPLLHRYFDALARRAG
jgi:3-dehydrosphinganine reductase